MVELIGFDGPEPTHVIIWNAEHQSAKKTICYSEQELNEQITMHAFKFDSYEIIKSA